MTNELSPRLRDFLGNGLCLIVEPSASFSANLQTCLSSLGVPLSQVMTARKLEDARQVIREQKPKIIISEYDVPPGLGLSLIEIQEGQYEETQRIAIIVTRNSSDSAIATSAEGAVDAFILKPFSTDVFSTKLNEVLERKLNPTPYERKIFEGRRLLAEQSFDQALFAFTEAKTLHPKPALASFYLGEVYRRQGLREEALAEFRAGRAEQPLHYKCLVGEFEILMEQEKYTEAYALAPTLRDNFPPTASRLGQLVIATVFTRHFDDLTSLYSQYLDLENRTSWLTELLSLAMLTAGKFSLREQDVSKALMFFEMGLTARGKELAYVAMAVDELLKAHALNEADAMLAKALPSDVGTPLHSQLRFRVDRKSLPPEQLIERGRRMAAEGLASPEVFEILIELLAKAGKETLAESMINLAKDVDVELPRRLYEILRRNMPAASPASDPKT